MRLSVIIWLMFLIACREKENLPIAAAPGEKSETERPASDNLLDRIQLVDLQNNPIDLKDYRGKTVFLNFWATWCKPCIQEMPSIQRAQQVLQDENFVFLLASDETTQKIKQFQASRDFELTFVKITNPFSQIGIYSIPATLVINPQGKISLQQIGALEWDAPEVLQKLRANNL